MIRGRRPTAADRRAMGFYEANNPALRLNGYRVIPPDKTMNRLNG